MKILNVARSIFDPFAAHFFVALMPVTSDSATFTDTASEHALRLWQVSASDSATFTDTASEHALRLWQKSASDSATFTGTAHGSKDDIAAAIDSARFVGTASAYFVGAKPVSAHDSFYFHHISAHGLNNHVAVAASDRATFRDRASETGLFNYQVVATDSFYFRSTASAPHILRALPETSPDGGTFTDVASATRKVRASAASSATFTGLAAKTVGKHKSASDTATFTDVANPRRIHVSASSSATFTDHVSDHIVPLGYHDTATFTDHASANSVLPSGLVIPGGDISPGLRYVLRSPSSGKLPFCYAESADGLLLIANGADPMLAWDGVEAQAWPAGVPAPDVVTFLDSSGVGLLTGVRYAFTRFVDSRGNFSNLSPISDPIDLGHDGFVQDVLYSHTAGGTVTIYSRNHRLTTGNTLLFTGVGGTTFVNGQHAITVVDVDHFTLNSFSAAPGTSTYTSGGVWTKGASTINYTHVPVSTNQRTARRQILRNLEGNASVFYLDVDTTDLVSTSFSSTLSDEALAARLAVPLHFEDRAPASNIFYPPPSHKKAIVAYAGRIFATADLVYTAGNVRVTLGSPVVVGIGTEFTTQMIGRLLYVDGSTVGQLISDVMVDEQFLVLETPYSAPSNTIAFYAVRPAPVERRLVYFTEPNLPEAWPPWNAFAVPESSDEIVGIVVQKSFLYVLKERNIYKFAFREDPGRDGYIFPVVVRGCVNNRCYAYVEGKHYLLDESGIYSFDGDAAEPVSAPVQSLFKPDGVSAYQIDWSADRTLWSCVHDQAHEVIRWFVDLVGRDHLTFAVCYDYRRTAWWLEEYPEPATSSALAVVDGYRQPVIGVTCRRVAVVGQGSLDMINEGTNGVLSGTVTSADSVSMTDTEARFPTNLAGVPVTVVAPSGDTQQSIISENTTTTITIVRPWSITPGSTYQVGGVHWKWKTGWRSMAADESENPRDLEVVFQATAQPSSFNCSVFYDGSAAPYDGWGLDQVNDGVTITAASSAIKVDLSTQRGFAIQRMSGHNDPYSMNSRYVAVQLEGVQSAEPTRIFQVTISGAQ